MIAAILGSLALVVPMACGSDDDSTDTTSSGTDQSESTSPEHSSDSSHSSGEDPYAVTREAASHMPMTADALASGFDTALKLPGTADSDAAALRASLTYLLTEHVYLAGIAVDTAYVAGADSAEFKLAAAALDENSVALADAVGSIAGDAKRKVFLQAWRSHINDFVSYAVAAKEGDNAGKQEALKNLAGYQKVAGKFFEEITGGALPASAVEASLSEHVKTLAAAIDAFASGDGTGFDKLKAAADHMPMTAMALADGIDQATDTAGNPNDQASEVRALLNAKLTEHVYLAGIAVFTAYVDGADSESFAAAAATLDDNSVEIADAVGSLTDQATRDSFLQSWRTHIDNFVSYAVGVAEDDQAAQDEAQEALQGYAEAQGRTLSKLTGGALPAAPVQMEFEMHIASLTAAIDALAAALLR
ncbi:MAG TPA: hypothetical protein VEX15_16955 [Nocardioidaceae bacterium]|nr:hypothetical protein [Nocardioidaceae bacterium]